MKAFDEGIEYYTKRDPNDKYAFIKGCFKA